MKSALIKFCFNLGLHQTEILYFHVKNHNIISLRQLKRLMKKWGCIEEDTIQIYMKYSSLLRDEYRALILECERTGSFTSLKGSFTSQLFDCVLKSVFSKVNDVAHLVKR